MVPGAGQGQARAAVSPGVGGGPQWRAGGPRGAAGDSGQQGAQGPGRPAPQELGRRLLGGPGAGRRRRAPRRPRPLLSSTLCSGLHPCDSGGLGPWPLGAFWLPTVRCAQPSSARVCRGPSRSASPDPGPGHAESRIPASWALPGAAPDWRGLATGYPRAVASYSPLGLP